MIQITVSLSYNLSAILTSCGARNADNKLGIFETILLETADNSSRKMRRIILVECALANFLKYTRVHLARTFGCAILASLHLPPFWFVDELNIKGSTGCLIEHQIKLAKLPPKTPCHKMNFIDRT